MKKIPLLLCLALITQTGLFAQTFKGRVIDDSTGTGLPGVTLQFSGTSKALTSGPDGSFSLSFPADGKKHDLLVSHTGYTTQTIAKESLIEGITIRLKRQVAALEDVVIIGYQSVKRRDVLASVSSIGARQIKDIPINSAEEALAGRLAGVQVTGSEGSPNAQVMIRVRGGGSVTQDNSPLYVVDGIQVDNALSTLSPQDIESIDVLKDAASTSIYGARGANGVVIITTKGGHNTNGRTVLSYNGFVGLSKIEKELPVLSPYDYMYYQYERAKLTGDSSGITPYGYSWDTVQKYKNVQPYDWQHKVLGRTAFQTTNNVSMSGGTDRTQYSLSLTDNRQDGIMLLSDYDRKLVSFRLDHNATDRLKVGFTVRYNNTIVDGAGTSNTGSSSLNFLRQVVRYRPFIVAGQSDNSFDANYYAETNANSLSLVNPVLLNQAQYRKNFTNVLNISGYANYTFSKWASFRVTAGMDDNNLRQDAFDDTLTYNSKNNGASMPIADITVTDKRTYDVSNVFTLTNTSLSGRFNEKNKFTLILGEETYQTHEKDSYTETRYFPLGTTAPIALANMNLGTPPTGSVEPKPTTTDIPTALFSYFTRLTYGYDNKYLTYLSVRRDGSSLFGVPYRWGNFPSATVAWRVSQENFMSKVNWVNDLKLRASYGSAGNNRISPFLFTPQFNTSAQYGLNDQLVTAYASAAFANAHLKWETTISRNIGVDATMFNNRFGLTLDVYNNSTHDLLINIAEPTNTGYTTQPQNVGSTSNKGVEVQLTGTLIQHRKFTWTANFNISFNQNKITSLGGSEKSFLQNSGWAGSGNPSDYIVQVGQPVGAMYGLKSDGFYKTSDFTYHPATRTYTLNSGVPNDASITATTPMPGSIKYKGLNGDTIISASDRTVIGHAQPKFFGGLTQTFSFMGFDMSIFINFQYGNKVYNYNKLEFSSGYTPGANLIGLMKNRWHTVDGNGNMLEGLNSSGQVVGATPDSLNALNKGAKYWIPLVGSSATTFMPQSWAVEDASFIRINNITLGYTLPASLVHKVKVSRVRVYATVNNVAVITGYSGYDPEVNTRRDTPVTPGVDYSAYPRSRNYITGINVTF